MDHSSCLLIKRYPAEIHPQPTPDPLPDVPDPVVPLPQYDCDDGYTKVPVGPPINEVQTGGTVCQPPIFSDPSCPYTYIIVTPGLIAPGCMGSFIKKCTVLCDGTQICTTTFQHSCQGYLG